MRVNEASLPQDGRTLLRILRCGAGRTFVDVAVARANNKVGTVRADLDLMALSRLSRYFRVVAQAVLSAQFFCDLSKRIRKILVCIVDPCASAIGEIVQISISPSIVFTTGTWGTTGPDNASSGPYNSASASSQYYAAQNIAENAWSRRG